MLAHNHVVFLAGLALLVGSGAPLAQTAVPTTNTTSPPPAAHPVIKPGDRLCLRQTGSRIQPRHGRCLGVAGRSYSGDELQHTGAPDTARALQMLDPSVRRGR